MREHPTMSTLVRIAGVAAVILATGLSHAPAAAQMPAAAPTADVLERRSPQDAVSGFLQAADAGDYERAARFLDAAALPRGERPQAARELRAVLAQQVWIDPATLSSTPEGTADDGLPPDRESLGWLETPDGPHAVVLERLDREGGRRWLFSAGTVKAARQVYDAYGYGRLTALLPPILVDYQFLNLQLWQWIGLLVLVLVAYLVAWVVARILLALIAPLVRRTEMTFDDRILGFIAGPVRLVVAVGVFSVGRLPLELTAAARAILAGLEYLLIVLAVAWTVMRLLDLLSEVLRERLLSRGQTEAMNLLTPGRRAAKAVVVALTVIAALDGFGFSVTAVLAGLGVGGIAVALAAQKSIENLFGAITLYGDRPVRVGDFCRFGDRVGTVEDIGLRSTRIRTLDRCIVSVPNAEFANLHLENFSARDKFWYHPTIGLRYETTPDQLRYVLVEVRQMLYAHPKVDPSPARIRFTNFGAYSLDLEIFAYVLVPDYDSFLEVAEDLNLRIMDIVAAAGSSFAFPSQTTYLESGEGLDAERSKQAEQAVAAWREREALYLPRFTPEKISELRGTLDYPPKGAPPQPGRPGQRGDGARR